MASERDASGAPTVVLETQAACSPFVDQPAQRVSTRNHVVGDLNAISSVSTYSSAQISRSSTEVSDQGKSHEGVHLYFEAHDKQVAGEAKVQE